MTSVSMDIQGAIGELSQLTRKYPIVYRQVESTLKPGFLEKIFSRFGFVGLRLARLRRSIDLLDSRATEAFQTIDKILSVASSIRSTLVSENEKAIGRSVRLANDLNFKQQQTQAMRTACMDTLQLIQKYDLLKLPESYLNWTKISFDRVVPPQGMSIIERTRHQRAWANLIKLINEEKEIMSNIEIANRRYEWTSKHESICETSIQGFETERYQLREQVDRLKSAITIGEIQEIERFLSNEFQRQIPFDDLVVEDANMPNSLGDYEVEVEIEADRG